MHEIDWADVMAWVVVARADPSSGMATASSCRFGRMLLESISESLRRAYLDGQCSMLRPACAILASGVAPEPTADLADVVLGPQEFIPHG